MVFVFILHVYKNDKNSGACDHLAAALFVLTAKESALNLKNWCYQCDMLIHGHNNEPLHSGTALRNAAITRQ